MIGALLGSDGWFERGGAQRPEEVVGAPGEFPGYRQAGAGVREPARLERVIVGIVGAGAMAGRLGGLEQGPPQRC